MILQTQPGAAPGFATGQGKDTEKQEHHPSVPWVVPAIALSPGAPGLCGHLAVPFPALTSLIVSPRALVTGL